MYNFNVMFRLFDFFFSIISLVVCLPFFFIIAILIKLDSEGPVFFLQERLGKNKYKFKIIKFRTMYHKDRISNGQTHLDDPEITRFGRILRRYKLDELPQYINVLLGDMSVVGPRPCLEITYNKFKNADTDFRFLVKPGVTSNVGVSGSIFLSWPEKWNYDKNYALTKSLSKDFAIVIKTVGVVIWGEAKFKK